MSEWLLNGRHQRLIERWWIALTILWEGFKTFVIGKTFSKYGLDPLIYFAIVISISIPYAKLLVQLAVATILEKWTRVVLLAPLALTLHFIPDLYIILATDKLPTYLFDTLIVVVLLFFALGIRTFIISVQRKKKAK